MIDHKLKQWATARQCEIIDAVNAEGSGRKAAIYLGVDKSYVNRSIKAVQKRAALAGYSPDYNLTHAVPDGFKLKGASTLYNADGEVTQQWIKSAIDQQRQEEIIKEVVAAFISEIVPIKGTRPPEAVIADLLNCYIITDFHLGMMSWHEETGADWDTKIAETLLYEWFAAAIARSPEAETAIFVQLGDFLHWDGLDAITPAHHNLLDADTRFQKLVRVAIRSIRRIMAMLLEKHKHVHVIMAEGNHDPAGSIWLREFMKALYQEEPRVTVDTSADSYYCYEHGKTSLFFHHGHKRKPENIHDVFAAKYRDIFGRTKFSYAHMGHMHNSQVRETKLMVVEQHRTLAAPDAYASRGGHMSGREAQVITYHKEYGKVGTVVISPEMVK